MLRKMSVAVVALALGVVASHGDVAFNGQLNGAVETAKISGNYLETRTCDVFTGPCFANAQVGLAGQQAILAWNIEQGSHQGIDLSGLSVVLAIRASDTLGFGGGVDVHPDPIKSVALVDERADAAQQSALVDFAILHAGRVSGEVVRVATLPIEISVDHVDMVARLSAGKEVRLLTRKLGKGDCVCTNEVAFYPPLTDVENSSPAYTVQGGFDGRGLGSRWTNPRTRSAYLATFAY